MVDMLPNEILVREIFPQLPHYGAILRAVSRRWHALITDWRTEAAQLRWYDVNDDARGMQAAVELCFQLKCERILQHHIRTQNNEIPLTAARYGRLDILQQVCANDCLWNEWTCAYAAAGGHLTVLQWARENACPWDSWTCAWAAGNGHLTVLQWARENGCPWDELTCAWAAEDGNLTVLQWARANGCPWDERTCEYAADGDHLNVLQWAHSHGCPYDKQGLLEYNLQPNVRDYILTYM